MSAAEDKRYLEHLPAGTPPEALRNARMEWKTNLVRRVLLGEIIKEIETLRTTLETAKSETVGQAQGGILSARKIVTIIEKL